MFEKLLIADRGEVVLRIARTCERVGVVSIAVHSSDEANATHAAACDEAAGIEGSGDANAYLNAEAILAIATQHGAQAVHPGYSRLGHDPAFARAVADAGLTFIGPSPEALTAFSDLPQGREIARLAGARVLEQDMQRPRLLAVLLIADSHGECVALIDFEHSLERAGRTVLAESPAPAWTSMPHGNRRRQTLCDIAASIAKEGKITGAATAEFLLDPEGNLVFSHLRLGLTPEHALWEMCTGKDLVEAQLRVAAGEALPAEILRQPSGNAAFGHIYAELPPSHARAQPFDIKALRWPVVAPGALRIETDLAVGSQAGTHYDTLVAKVIAYGQSRHQALLTLDRVLAEATIDPLPTNLPFLREILADEAFRAGQYDSDFAERLLAELRAAPR